jgi:hypothetical protein
MFPKKSASEIKEMITDEMIHCASVFVAAKAMVQTISPIVTGYQTEILRKRQFTNKGAIERGRKKAEARGVAVITIPVEVILDPDLTYNLSEDDFEIYQSDCRIEQAKNGLVTETPEQCPLLVAESLCRNARNLFIDSMEPITKINSSQVLTTEKSLDNLEKMAELSLRLLGSLGLVKAFKF